MKANEFRAQALESQNMRVFVGMVKGDNKLKVFHSMVKYNDMFATNNLSGSVIGFMGDRPLDGMPWVFNIPQDKSWAWTEVECAENAIECRATLERKETTTSCGIQKGILQNKSRIFQDWRLCPMQWWGVCSKQIGRPMS